MLDHFAALFRERNMGNCGYCGSEINHYCDLDTIQDLGLCSLSLGTVELLDKQVKAVIQPAYYGKYPPRKYSKHSLEFC